jgi:IS30 family transposase
MKSPPEGYSIRGIARALGRSPDTIKRAIVANDIQPLDYRPLSRADRAKLLAILKRCQTLKGPGADRYRAGILEAVTEGLDKAKTVDSELLAMLEAIRAACEAK